MAIFVKLLTTVNIMWTLSLRCTPTTLKHGGLLVRLPSRGRMSSHVPRYQHTQISTIMWRFKHPWSNTFSDILATICTQYPVWFCIGSTSEPLMNSCIVLSRTSITCRLDPHRCYNLAWKAVCGCPGSCDYIYGYESQSTGVPLHCVHSFAMFRCRWTTMSTKTWR